MSNLVNSINKISDVPNTCRSKSAKKMDAHISSTNLVYMASSTKKIVTKNLSNEKKYVFGFSGDMNSESSIACVGTYKNCESKIMNFLESYSGINYFTVESFSEQISYECL